MNKNGITYRWYKNNPYLERTQRAGKWGWLREKLEMVVKTHKTLVFTVPNEERARFSTAIYNFRKATSEFACVEIRVEGSDAHTKFYVYVDEDQARADGRLPIEDREG